MFQKGDIFDGTARIIEVRKGGMGVVYICEGRLEYFEGKFAIKTYLDLEGGLRYSLKDSFPEARSSNLRRCFVQEARHYLKLPVHPHIVDLFAVQDYQGIPYIIMDYIDGPNLRDLITKGPLDLFTALSYAVQIASALQFAWESSKLVHRDIKPENVLISTEGIAKIADFGLSTALAEESLKSVHATQAPATVSLQTSVAEIVGTLPYIAPEQAISDGRLGLQSDIYAFGVLLYEMLAGRRPYLISNPEQMLNAITSKIPLPLSAVRQDVPESVSFAIAKCLSKQPTDRFEDYSELIDILSTAASSLPGHVPISPNWIDSSSTLNHVYRKSVGLMNLGLNEEALKHLESYGYDARQSPELFHVAATVYGNLGEHEKAVTIFDKALASESAQRKRMLFNKGNSLIALNRFEEAIQCNREALDLDLYYTNAMLGVAHAYNSSGDYAQAIQWCEKTLVLEPKHPSVWSILAIAQAKLGDTSAATKTLKIAVEKCSQTPLALLNFAAVYAEIGESRTAQALMSDYLSTSHGLEEETTVQALLIALKTKDENVVRETVERIFRLNPSNSTLLSLELEIFEEMQIDALLAVKDFDGAWERVEEALKKRPKAPLLLLRKALILRAQDKIQDAVEMCDVVLRADQANASAHEQKGHLYIELERFEEALTCFSKALELGNESANVFAGRATALVYLERFVEALQECETALLKEPKNFNHMRLKGQLLSRAKQHEQAISWFNHLLSANSESVELLDDLYYCFRDLGDLDEAAYCCTRILKMSPKDFKAWHNKGEALCRLGKYLEALECYMNAVAIKRDSYQSYTGIGVIHLLSRDYEEAITYFSKALEYKRDFTVALNNLIVAQVRREVEAFARATGGNEEELINEAEQGLRERGINISLRLDGIVDFQENVTINVKPQSESDYFRLREQALELAEKGQLNDAVLLFKRVVHEVPSDYESWHALGTCLDLLGMHADAISCFDQVLNSAWSPNTPAVETLNSKGETLRKLGQTKEAMQLFDQVLELNPEHEFAWNNKGLCFTYLEKLDDAKSCYRRALQVNQNSWRALGNLGMLESGLGNREAALECAAQLELLSENNSTIHAGLCAIYFNLRLIQKAKIELDKARACDPSSPEVQSIADVVESAWRAQQRASH